MSIKHKHIIEVVSFEAISEILPKVEKFQEIVESGKSEGLNDLAGEIHDILVKYNNSYEEFKTQVELMSGEEISKDDILFSKLKACFMN